jgi:carbon-monoxide dehydrogenase medium subunit
MFDTALEDGDLITRVIFPVLPEHAGAAYAKFPNPASRFAVAGVAAYVELDAHGACQTARIAITGAAPMVFRAEAMEQALIGQSLDDATIAAACTPTPDPDELMSDLSGSATYRAHLCGVMAKRALTAAAKSARNG